MSQMSLTATRQAFDSRFNTMSYWLGFGRTIYHAHRHDLDPKLWHGYEVGATVEQLAKNWNRPDNRKYYGYLTIHVDADGIRRIYAAGREIAVAPYYIVVRWSEYYDQDMNGDIDIFDDLRAASDACRGNDKIMEVASGYDVTAIREAFCSLCFYTWLPDQNEGELPYSQQRIAESRATLKQFDAE